MKELSPFEKLDAVLKGLADRERSQHFHKSIADITFVVDNIVDVEIILKKLIKDGYADKMDRPPSNDALPWLSDRIYSLTFEGALLIQQGGYFKKI